jgi:hypothetical protein
MLAYSENRSGGQEVQPAPSQVNRNVVWTASRYGDSVARDGDVDAERAGAEARGEGRVLAAAAAGARSWPMGAPAWQMKAGFGRPMS